MSRRVPVWSKKDQRRDLAASGARSRNAFWMNGCWQQKVPAPAQKNSSGPVPAWGEAASSNAGYVRNQIVGFAVRCLRLAADPPSSEVGLPLLVGMGRRLLHERDFSSIHAIIRLSGRGNQGVSKLALT